MSTFLKRAVIAAVAAMAIGGSIQDASAQNNSTIGSTTVVGTAVNPWDTWMVYTIDYYDIWDDPTVENPWFEDGTGWEAPLSCEVLAVTKPDKCPNPVLYPSGPDFGLDKMASGSGIPKALYFVNHQSGARESAKKLIVSGLAHHTNDIAERWVTADIANQYLLSAVATACRTQREEDTALRNELALQSTPAERQCYATLDRMIAEAGETNFSSWFVEWLKVNQIDYTVPDFLIALLDPSNSLTVKFDQTTQAAKCHDWWKAVQAQQCAI